MKLNKLFFLFLTALLAMSLGFVVACGDDDDDDDDDDSAGDDDDDAAGDDDDDTADPVDQLIDQAYGACVDYWTTCEYDGAEDLCQAWVDAYRPAIEAYADTMDMDCMMEVMNNFFACVGGDCDPTGAWVTCNAAVEEEMMQCF